jgi:predicted ATPase
VVLEGLPFFGSFSWRLNPGINILLGRNGYGKSHFLSIVCAMLKNDYTSSEKLSTINNSKTESRFIKVYLAGDFNSDSQLISKLKEEINHLQSEIKTTEHAGSETNSARQIATKKESIRKKKIDIEVEEGMIMLTPSDLISAKGQIPVLAIPDMRFVNKAKEYTDSNISDLLKGDEYLKNTSSHFINQEPFESVLQNLLNLLGVSYFENRKSFDTYIFKIISKVFVDLTGNTFKWNNCESDSNGSYRITVLTEGSTTPLAIQKISQGTFSVLSMVGLIYLFLKKKYPELKDEELVKEQAIIIIDEIDAHLHPLWQQKIVGIIRGIFENCQFIITAHSPMVVAGCKEDEVAVMRDERDENNNITGFMVYQFKEDFIGTPIDILYKKIFQVEEKDPQYQHYIAMQPFIGEMAEEKQALENKHQAEDLSAPETKRLKQLAEDLYYADKIKEKQGLKHSASMLESENIALKITVDTLKQKMDEIENKTEKKLAI